MSLFDPPRCPNCSSVIDLKELWRAAPKTSRGSRLEGKIGVVCPMCGIKLRVLDNRIGIISVALFILMVVGMASLLQLSKSRTDDGPILFVLGILCIPGFIYFQKSIPKLLRLRLLEEGEKASFPLLMLVEELAAERKAFEEEEEQNPEPTEDAGPAWKSKSCGEENPGNFDECWKCQTWRVAEASK